MQLHYVGKNIDVTDALKTYTAEKFQSIAERDNRIQHVNIIFWVEHLSHVAEANFHLDGIELVAKVESDDMYKSITELAHKLAQQVTKHKQKIIDQHR